LAASPDGIISIDCCGIGTLEIECFFCTRSETPDTVELEYLNDAAGKTRLKENHKYFYQVQAQLNICKLDYADFVVWTPGGIYVERIIHDEGFSLMQWTRCHHFMCMVFCLKF